MIEGKVAAIINSRELAINRGRKHDVYEGMRFAVLDTSAGVITDPDTDKQLGLVEGIKVRVEVVEVQDLFCIAQTYETVGGGISLGTLLAVKTATEFSRPVTLKTSEAIFAPLTEGESYVKRGDAVREIETEGS